MARAQITSTEAVRRLKAALVEFQEGVADALTMLELESRRPVEWIETDRTMYWPRMVREASDNVASARINLERCEIAIRPDDKRSCYDEKKAFAKAKERMRLAESKVQAVRRWRMVVKKEVEEFQVQLSKLRWYLDSDFHQAIASLERMAAALDRYVERAPPDAQTQEPTP